MAPIFAAAAPEHGGLLDSIQELVHGLGINTPSLIAQIVNFTVVAFVLYRFAVKPVLATIEQRQKSIADGLRYAEEMKQKLADAEKQHAETMKRAALDAQKVVDDARTSAKELLDREARATTEKTQHMLAKAEEAISLERRKMLADARDEISRLVALTAQRVLSRELAPDERKRFAESAARDLTNN